MDKPLDEKGLADYLGVSHEWVRDRVKRREIPFTRLPGGKLVRFWPEHIAAIRDECTEPALSGPLAGRRLSAVPQLGHPPAGPQTPPPPPRPSRGERVA